jgi:hypothetical protein
MSGPIGYESTGADALLRDFFEWCGESDGYVPTDGELIEYLEPRSLGVLGSAQDSGGDPGNARSVSFPAAPRGTVARRQHPVGQANVSPQVPRPRHGPAPTVALRAPSSARRRRLHFSPKLAMGKAEFRALNLGLEDLPSPDNSRGFEGFPSLERVARKCPAVEDIKAFIGSDRKSFHSYRLKAT